MKDLIIIGAGGFGRELAWVIELINQKKPEWNLLGFVDNDSEKHGMKFHDVEVLGDLDYLNGISKSTFLVCAIANTKIRKRIVESLNEFKFAKIIAPDVLIGSGTEIGEGSIICSHSLITVDSTIGKHCILDFKTMIGHDTIISDYVTFYPNSTIAGNVKIKEGVEMGTASSMKQGITIGEYSVVGAGAVVVNDIESNLVVAGVPAKTLHKS